MLLAIETSCDETAVAIFSPDKRLPVAEVISSQIKLHIPYGGVVPELAARAHVTNLPIVIAQVMSEAGCSFERLTHVAVTQGPGLKGCLLVGVSFAKALAFSRGIPLIPVHHIEGHLLAAELVEEGLQPQYPALALVVSGGHTMLVWMESFRNYQVVASTRDDAAGEAFDKSATLLGLPYPGGPSLSRLAANGDATRFAFPIGMRGEKESFSFSGLKTAVYRRVTQLKEDLSSGPGSDQLRADLAASVQGAIVSALVQKSVEACAARKPSSFILTGGVAANSVLRASLAQAMGELGVKFYVPEFRWCTDNASMIGVVARNLIAQERKAFQNWHSMHHSSGLLGPTAGMDLGAVARWPLEEICGQQAPR